MNKHSVAFIAFRELDNLGIGYLASVLSNNGYKTTVIDFKDRREEILGKIESLNPLIVGFSVIFQYHIYEFRELINYLRDGGIKNHFTAGGHYASLKYAELFEIIPALDSVVRFEGEYTLLDLADSIRTKKDWRKVQSIAFRESNKMIVNSLRPLEADLDKFPLPVRSPLKNYALNRKFSTILAGRGCIHDCAFCDIREFYQQPYGPNKRIRRPEMVVQEMEMLHLEKDCSVFLFQDDDFPVKTDKGSDWVKRFCGELAHKNLVDKIMWKINCRPDEVDLDSFTLMKNHGLFLVFLGIEDGTDVGLNLLNKHMTVEKCLEGISILKKLKIGFDYGFMLFQPGSTYRSLNDNLDFLSKICSNGYTSVTFLKMLPYFETRIEKELRKEGRLKGKPGFLDYDFLDESLNHYYKFTSDCLDEWLRMPNGLLSVSRWARNYISVFSRYFEPAPEIDLLSDNITKVISQSNLFLLENMKKLATEFESGKYNTGDYCGLDEYRIVIKTKHDNYREQIKLCIMRLFNIASVQQLF
jgi:anaerobic magnesium-protoporphyrin IX monomethyl ester cyclase